MTFSSALPILIRLQRKRKMLKMVLGCNGKEHGHPVPESCSETPDLDWSHCPLDLLDSPYLAAVHQLNRLADISPLAGWPTNYAAWAVAGVMTLREGRQ